VIAYSIYNEGNAEPWNVSGGADYIASIVAEVEAADTSSSSSGGGGSDGDAEGRGGGEDFADVTKKEKEEKHANARLIDAASGWHQADAGSILSSHSYDLPSVPNCSAPGTNSSSFANASRGHYGERTLSF
jgi:hypothetical protein